MTEKKKTLPKAGEEAVIDVVAATKTGKAGKPDRKSMEEKMEAGKIEIMKVVEGVQGAEKLGDLIEQGKKKGKLSSSELMDVLESMDLESEQMDKIYDTLENLGIETAGEDYLPDLPDDGPPLEEIEEIPEEEIVDPNSLVDSFGIDDPGSPCPRIWVPGTQPRSSWRSWAMTWTRRPGRSYASWTERVRRPNSVWPRPTFVWWSPSPSGMWAGGCFSWI